VLGRTPLQLFRVNENPPTLLRPGDCVQFRRITRAQFDVFEQ
jgi:Allophanate hydrolase subunit 1